MDVFSMEVAFKILSYLEKEDLLNCRFVCDSWNKECVSILRKSEKHNQILTHTNIATFVEFSTASEFNPILPFHLRVEDKTTKQILDSIVPLIGLYGEECFHKVTVNAGLTDITGLLEILSKTSAGLASLVFRGGVHGVETRDWEYDDDFVDEDPEDEEEEEEGDGENEAPEGEDEDEHGASDENEGNGIEAGENENDGTGSENNVSNNEVPEVEVSSDEDTSYPPWQPSIMSFHAVSNLLSKYNFVFPKLKELKYSGLSERAGTINYIIYASVVRGCRNLEKLMVSNFHPSLETAFPIEKLKCLEVTSLEASGALLQKFREKQPSTLTLKVDILEVGDYARIEGFDDMFFDKFLSCFAFTLTSIRIPLRIEYNESPICYWETYPLPYLPNLKALAVQTFSYLIILDTTQLNFNPSTLPSLEAVHIPPTCYLVESRVHQWIQGSGDTFRCVKSQDRFQNVNHITLNADSFLCDATKDSFDGRAQWRVEEEEEYEIMNMQSGIDDLLQVFPSATKITLNNLQVESSGSIVVQMLERLIRSPYSAGIKELEILNVTEVCEHDYLGVLVRKFAEFQAKGIPAFLTSIEKIRLIPPPCLSNSKRESIRRSAEQLSRLLLMDLSLLSKYMPGLFEIGIPTSPFNYLCGDGQEARQQKIKRIKETYSQFTFDMIYPNPSDYDPDDLTYCYNY